MMHSENLYLPGWYVAVCMYFINELIQFPFCLFQQWFDIFPQRITFCFNQLKSHVSWVVKVWVTAQISTTDPQTSSVVARGQPMMLRGMMWHCGNNRGTWGSLDYSYLCGIFHGAPPTCGRQLHVHYRSNLATDTHMLTESAGTNYVMVWCTNMCTSPSYLLVYCNRFKQHFLHSSLKWKVIFTEEMYPIYSRFDNDYNNHATCQSSFSNLEMEDV